jgi:hypothetical protein
MLKSNAKTWIEEKQRDGQIKCKLLDRRKNKELDKSNAKS